jgi:hypothetical protein
MGEERIYLDNGELFMSDFTVSDYAGSYQNFLSGDDLSQPVLITNRCKEFGGIVYIYGYTSLSDPNSAGIVLTHLDQAGTTWRGIPNAAAGITLRELRAWSGNTNWTIEVNFPAP